MNGFFTPKNLATLGGVILSFVVPHVLFSDEQYEIEYVPAEDEQDETPTTPEEAPEEKEQ